MNHDHEAIFTAFYEQLSGAAFNLLESKWSGGNRVAPLVLMFAAQMRLAAETFVIMRLSRDSFLEMAGDAYDLAAEEHENAAVARAGGKSR